MIKRKHREYGSLPSNERKNQKRGRYKAILERAQKFRKTITKPMGQATQRTKKIKPRRVLKTLVWVFVIAGIIVGLGGVIMVAAVSRNLPDPDKLTDRVVAQSTKIYDRTGKHLLYEIFSEQKRTLVELEEVPTYAIDATIAVEDKKFFEHKGVRWVSILRATVNNALGRKIGSGGASTLTQQLVKNTMVGNERSYIRKIKEAMLATKIEKTYTKNQILKLYFNEIAYGSTNYGIEAASQSYFGKTVKDITLAEAAALAALPQAPTKYLNNMEAFLGRRDFILGTMAEQGYITPAQAQSAKQEPLEIKKRLEGIEAPHFVLHVKEQLTERFGEKIVETGGLTVRTTLDYDLQKIAEEEVVKGCEHNAEFNQASNAALVAIDPRTGEVVSMVGSCDYFNDDIDGQVNVPLRPRQPGSSFKPFVYYAGFERGYTPNTVLYDAVTNFAASGKPYQPHNYDGEERGPVTVRRALQGSLNIPAVKMLYLAGVNNVLENAQKIGYSTFDDPDRYGLALVLGGAEVKLLEHTNAYATLANEGRYRPAISILEVRDENETLWEQKPSRGEQALDKDVVTILTNVLSDDAARAYAFGAGGVLSLPGRPVAAKTGTTNDYRDGWTLGYTPSLTAGVWVGNNNNEAMRRGVGGSIGAGPIWQAFMKRALEGKPAESFAGMPKITAQKPILNGTDDGGVPVKIDRVSGKLATEDTPEELTDEIIFLQPHSILHYVIKDDPDGPYPTNPSDDPQYTGWESGVQTWIENKKREIEKKGEELKFVLGEPPTEYDDIHKKELRPTLLIHSPQSGQTINDRIISTNVEVSAPRGVAKVVYILNDTFIGTVTDYPFNLNYQAHGLENGQHTLKIKAYDDVSNLTEIELPFILDAIPQPPDVTWVAPKLNNTLFSSLFPLTLQMRPFKADKIGSIKIFVHRENEDTRTALGEITKITDLVELRWNEIPEPATYILEPKIILKTGETINGTENKITVR